MNNFKDTINNVDERVLVFSLIPVKLDTQKRNLKFARQVSYWNNSSEYLFMTNHVDFHNTFRNQHNIVETR